MMCEMTENCNALEDIREIKQSLSRIQTALLGDEYNPHGVLQKISVLETKVKDIQNRFNMIKWVALGFGLAGTGAGAFLTKFIMQL